jgi:hypothetical protein
MRLPVENLVKIRPLPETDLARIAPLPAERKLTELERFRLGRPPYAYRPLRNSLSDILNVEAALFKLPNVPWANLAKIISQQSRSPEEEVANLQVAEGLYRYAQSKQITGRKHEFMPLALGVGLKIVYWHSLILIDGDIPFVPFFGSPSIEETYARSASLRVFGDARAHQTRLS